MRVSLLALGFTTTVAQVLLVRELVAVFYGNELVLGLILAAWLAWGALGAGLSGRLFSCSQKSEDCILAQEALGAGLSGRLFRVAGGLKCHEWSRRAVGFRAAHGDKDTSHRDTKTQR